MWSRRRTDLLCIALLVATATVFFSDVLFAGSNFYFRDLFPYHFPMKHVVRQAMLSGEFPFWNRFYSGGQPLAANPAYELFYPLQWLILVGTYPFGFALHIVVHVYVALAGMYLLLRQMRLGVPSSVFGALSFGMGGLLLGSMTMLPTFFVWALAPIVGWGVLRLIEKPDPARVGVAALLAGMQLLIGEPIALLQVWLLIGAGSLLYVRHAGAGLRRVAGTILLVVVIAGAVASVQLVPAIDHAANSARARGIPFSTVREFSMPMLRPLELVVPHLFGRLDPNERAFWGAKAFDRLAPYLHSIYCGIAVTILVIAGWIIRSPGTGTTIVLGIVSYILAIGDSTPLLHILYDSNIARGIRYPEKFAAFAVVALVVFAATVAERLLAGDEKVRRACTLAGGIVAAISAIPVFWTMTPQYTQSFLSWWGLPPQRAALASVARQTWLTGLLIAAAAAVLLVLFKRMQRRLWVLLTLTLIVVDLFVLGDDIVTRLPRPFFTPPPIVVRLDPDRDRYALFNRSEWQPYRADYQRYEATSSPWFARNSLRPFTGAAWGFRSNLELDFDETDLLPTHDLLDAMMKLGNSGFEQWGEAFAAISNVRYIIDLRPFEHVLRESNGDLSGASPVRFTRMPQPDRYFFPAAVIDTRSIDAVLAAMRRRIPIGTAYVPFAPPSPAVARVIAVRESANAASIDVEASRPALLVATVTRHKYWRAEMDGRPAHIMPANIAYQAVLVPAGRHRVDFRYANPLVTWGGLLSAAAVLACVAATIPRRPRRRLQTGS